MFGFRSMKDIKKKLKRKRRPMWTLAMLAGIFIAAAASGIGGAWIVGRAVFDIPAMVVPSEAESATIPSAEAADKPHRAGTPSERSREAVLQSLAHWQGDVEVILRRKYWCGEETRLLGHHTTKEASDLLKSRRDCEASFDASGRLIFVANEEDADNASAACRQNAYVAMDPDGNLKLFDGPPRKDNVVRTFFQLDVRSLESSMSPDMLRGLIEGIRVADPHKLNSLVAYYKEYARDKSVTVIKPD